MPCTGGRGRVFCRLRPPKLSLADEFIAKSAAKTVAKAWQLTHFVRVRAGCFEYYLFYLYFYRIARNLLIHRTILCFLLFNIK